MIEAVILALCAIALVVTAAFYAVKDGIEHTKFERRRNQWRERITIFTNTAITLQSDLQKLGIAAENVSAVIRQFVNAVGEVKPPVIEDRVPAPFSTKHDMEYRFETVDLDYDLLKDTFFVKETN